MLCTVGGWTTTAVSGCTFGLLGIRRRPRKLMGVGAPPWRLRDSAVVSLMALTLRSICAPPGPIRFRAMGDGFGLVRLAVPRSHVPARSICLGGCIVANVARKPPARSCFALPWREGPARCEDRCDDDIRPLSMGGALDAMDGRDELCTLS
eukprot:4729868-Prymnesium_polylepis.1